MGLELLQAVDTVALEPPGRARRWHFGIPATILVERPGGFPEGEHKLALRQKLRISYLPFPSFNDDEKIVRLS